MQKNIDIIQIKINYEQFILLSENRIAFDFSKDWKNNVSTKAGVYVFFEENKIVYIGEIKSLRSRMGDIKRTVNHTLRRKIGEILFNKIEGFIKASSKRKFPEHIEKLINEYMCKLKVVILPIQFGRCEVEEYLINKYEPIFNSKSLRGIV